MFQTVQRTIVELNRQVKFEKTQSSNNNFVFSPRFMPLTKPDQGSRFFSPDVMSLVDDNESSTIISSDNNIAPLKIQKGDRKSLLNLFMKVSSAETKFNQLKRSQSRVLRNKSQGGAGIETERPLNTLELEEKELNRLFKQLYKTMKPSQIDDMVQHGYTFMTPKQLNRFYGPNSLNITYNTSQYDVMDSLDREEALLSLFSDIGSRKREKRKAVVLGSSVLSPFIATGLVETPLILHPLVLSPLILSPSVLGPLVLSPSVFAPFVLSPLLLGGAYLSPGVGDPLILSPLVLFPIILSPLVLTPFVLSPLVLTPVVLSPALLTPLILSPLVLSPVILSPIVLSPLILCPTVLSPIIKSPVVSGAKVLAPDFASPHIQSAKHNVTVFASPSMLSKR